MKVAINGFGRIGRLVFRIIEEESDMEVVAINDLTNAEDLAYLLKYDTNHRNYKIDEITNDEDEIIIGSRRIKVYSEKDPANLPWKELGIDLVFECTGLFTDYEGAHKHIEAGAKKVVISAPAKDECKTIVYGVNENILEPEDDVISAASCTTNCLAPVLKAIDDAFGIRGGFMSTVHAMTNDQETLDIPHKKGIEGRRGRAASLNIIPTSTGAASTIGKVIPNLAGKLDGVSYRVPVGDGSIIDLSVVVSKETTKEEVNECFAKFDKDIIKVVNVPLVSSDIIGTTTAAIVDASLTNVIKSEGLTIVKVSAWYDNEWAYTAQMIRTCKSLFNC